MTLLRAAARSLLASYFIVSGAKAVKDPTPYLPAAEPVADRFVPLVKQYAPAQLASYVPEDAVTLVRLNGGMQLLGGLALASGKGRRLGALLLAASLVPSTLARHPFWTRDTPEERAADRAHFMKNTSLLGGVLLASADTEGKPSLAWRAQKGSHALARDTRRTGRRLAKDTRHLGDSALAEGAALVGAVVATSRKAKKKAARELKRTSRAAEKQAAQARETASAAAKQARKDARKFAKTARKQAATQIESARRGAERVTRNIHLGEN